MTDADRDALRRGVPLPRQDRRLSPGAGDDARNARQSSRSDKKDTPVPVHYELGARPEAEHVVLITLDRPEAKNAVRPRALPPAGAGLEAVRGRRRRLGGDLHRGRTGTSCPAPTSRPTFREITALARSRSRRATVDVDRRLLAVRRHRRRAARHARSTSRSSPRSTGPAWPAAWRCSAASTSGSPAEHATFGVLEPARGPVRRRRHHRAAAPPDAVRPGDGVPAVRRSDRRASGRSRWACSTRSSPRTSCWTRRSSRRRASRRTRRWRSRPPSAACWRA